jgi:hypothetical protein
MPVPTATSRMTAAVPIRMPSMVSNDRIRLASMPRRATRMLSIVTRDLTPRLAIDRCSNEIFRLPSQLSSYADMALSDKQHLGAWHALT